MPRHSHSLILFIAMLLMVLVGACSAEDLSDGAYEPTQDTTLGDDFGVDAASDSNTAPERCADGATRPAEDGCNSCTCIEGSWACTDAACACPAPTTQETGCNAVVVWAKAPATGECCMYGTACEAPVGWPQYYSAFECENACVEGETRRAQDGCNTCECMTDNTWACTDIACDPVRTCATDKDCVVSGCSGEICAVEPIGTTCEWREEYACYAPEITNCGCNQGTCGWAVTPELESCLGDVQSCTPGEVKTDDDGCNSCFCNDDGTWACTDRACYTACPTAGIAAPGQVCDDAIVYARDPLTGVCCEYPDSCGPPPDWETFGDLQSCTALTNCQPGDTRPANDGCNTCSCTEDGTWSCTEMVCARLCDTDADCLVTGCSGQICASEHVFTTCEFRDEYACYSPQNTSCGCIDGLCGWDPTDALTQCLDGGSAP